MPTYLMPPIDELDERREAALRAHLVTEFQRGVRPRPTGRRRAATAACLVGGAATVTGVVLGVAGPGKSVAFASWSATPQPVAPTLVDCPSAAGQAVLAEQRGDYTLTMVANGDNLTTCVTGDGLSLSSEDSAGSPAAADQVTLGLGLGGTRQAAGNAVVRRSAGSGSSTRMGSVSMLDGELQLGSGSDGLTVLHGRVGSGVSDVRVVRADGSAVTATIDGSWFAAWWPGSTAASTIQWTADGTSHSLTVPALPQQPAVGVPMPGGGTHQSGGSTGTFEQNTTVTRK